MSDDLDRFLAEVGEDEDRDQEAAPDPKKFKQWAYRERKARQALEGELRELREFQAKALESDSLNALKASGLTDRQAAVFLKTGEPVTPETIEAFKADLNIAQPAESEAAPKPPTGFPPTTGGEPSGARTYTRQDLERTFRENPSAGWALLNSGKVRFENLEEQDRG